MVRLLCCGGPDTGPARRPATPSRAGALALVEVFAHIDLSEVELSGVLRERVHDRVGGDPVGHGFGPVTRPGPG